MSQQEWSTGSSGQISDSPNPNRVQGSLPSKYDFIVCGAGSSGSVVASRLSESRDVSVLLLEAGRSDEVPEVTEPEKWRQNFGSERDWAFSSVPNPDIGGRSTRSSMGKVLGGGSSINAMLWLQGHRDDWDHYAEVTGEQAWSYHSVIDLYRRIEDWHGTPDPEHRGAGGPIHVEAAKNASPLAPALLSAAAAMGIPKFESHNGKMMQGDGGCALTELIIDRGVRKSVFKSYVAPHLNRPNLTVLSASLVTRILFKESKAIGVEALVEGGLRTFLVDREVILSLGAIQTPKVLMQSGIGPAEELRKHGIPVVQNLQGVGRNLQDHQVVDTLWEYADHLAPQTSLPGALVLGKSDTSLEYPDLLISQVAMTRASPELMTQYAPPQNCWGLKVGLLQPQSRGRVTLTGPKPTDPPAIDSGFFHESADVDAAAAGIELCRALGNSAALKPFGKQEVMPAEKLSLKDFARKGVMSFQHQTCTAQMGTDEISVVDGQLRVHGIQGLRIADGSVFPRIPRAATMAPCVVVGERASDFLKESHGIRTT